MRSLPSRNPRNLVLLLSLCFLWTTPRISDWCSAATPRAFQQRQDAKDQNPRTAARGLSAEQVFRKVSPSVYVVTTLDPDDPPGKQGSAVAIASDRVITNYHVVDGAVRVFVHRGAKKWVVKHFTFDKEHDLALLNVENLVDSGVTLSPSSKLRVGEPVYAVGAPEGLELTLSEGLVSALRKPSGEIQTTAAISHGSSGGGLFDSEGRLVGITAASLVEGQSLNFALPTEWIRALAAKHAAAERLAEDAGRLLACSKARLASTISSMPPSEIPEGFKNLHPPPTTDPACSLLDSEHDLNVPGSDNDPLSAYNFSEGDLELSVGEYESAEIDYRMSIGGDPDDPYRWTGLSRAYTGEGDYKRAAGAAVEALQIKPDDPGILLLLGEAYHNAGDCIDVVSIYQKLRLLDAQRAVALSQYCVRCNLAAY